MKKVFMLLLLLSLICILTLGFKKYFLKEKGLIFEKDNVIIEKYYIYGTQLNIEGIIPNIEYDSIKLLIKNEKNEIEYDLIMEENTFKTSLNSNEGINLESLSDSYLVIKTTKDKEIKYYPFLNKTEYETTTYYTFDNKKITISFDKTMEIKSTITNENIYDIVLDAGHGGIDTGAQEKNYNESELTLEYAKELKSKLEDEGFKVKLTREEDITLPSYGENSRTAISYESHAKYLFSIHFNSSEVPIYKGVEIYGPPHINYDFAKSFIKNITNSTKLSISNNKSYQIDDGICVRILNEYNINSMKEDAIKDGYEPYEIKNDTPYLYMLRETGGIIMNAYVDGRENNKKNLYYNSNVAPESYLLEIGYINNNSDLNIILNEKETIINAIKETIINEIKEKSN